MRVPRNYMSSLLNGRNMNSLLSGNSKSSGTSSLLQRALSRTNGSRRSRLSLQDSKTNGINRSSSGNLTGSVNAEKLYYNMKYHAGQVCDYADKLSDKGEDSVYEKAKSSGDTEEILTNIRGFVKQYNSMMANMKESGSRSDVNYQTQLNNLARLSSSELASTGVTRKTDGTLVIDEKKLAAADIETLEKVWGGSSSFASRAALRADSVEAYAERSMEAQASTAYSNLFNSYGSKGNYFNFFS
ncbi:MAG: hypothetical protein J6K48_13875 [Lachnospiraceae bacterium]|nr:hypothetical protein [Lachnospiraceae bacterium]